MGNVIYLAGRDQPAGVLLVESDPLVRIATAGYLRKTGLSVVEATNGREALKLLRAGRAILLVLGELEGSRHGFDVIAALQREFPAVKLLVGCVLHPSPVSRAGVATVGRPYDLPNVEKAVKILLAAAARN
jgi:CheY-like chemotaxis protein